MGQVIQGLFLAVVVLACMVRKFIGLELSTFLQIGFLSIVQNPEITMYQQPMTGWNSLFGYNQMYLSEVPA